MNERSISGVSIGGISAAVPQHREDNAELTTLDDRSRKEIIERVGIRNRHVADEQTTAADLCEVAAKKLLAELDWNPSEVELLAFVTQTPDHTVPGTATQLQHKLGLPKNAIALDINQGCAGYVYGLSVVGAMMRSMNIKRALLLVGDTITKMVSKIDASIAPIFADAGSATALELDDAADDMIFRMGSIGEEFEAIHIPHGGFRNPTTDESLAPKKVADGIERNLAQLSMNGQAVFTFGLSTVASEISALLSSQNLTASHFDYLVMHQANQFLNDSIARKTGFEKEQVPSSLHDFGNTSCATIPVTLVSQLANDLRASQLNLLLSGFGVGLSWGNVILTTDRLVCPNMIYV